MKKKNKATKIVDFVVNKTVKTAAAFSSEMIVATLKSKLLDALKADIPNGYKLKDGIEQQAADYVLSYWLKDMIDRNEDQFESHLIDVAEATATVNHFYEKVG